MLITGDDVMRPKPDPEAYYRALAELGVGAANVLAFEHSMAGFHTARSAGLATVVVTREQIRGHDFTGAAEVLDRHDWPEPLSACPMSAAARAVVHRPQPAERPAGLTLAASGHTPANRPGRKRPYSG